MRWPLVWIALGACKGDAPEKASKVERVTHVEPAGAQRFPEVDAAIDAMRPALLLAEPTETVSACKGPLEVEAIDEEAALLIAAGRAAPADAQFTTPQIAPVVRYASKSTLAEGDVASIRAWAGPRAPAFVWAFIETTARTPSYEGVVHVVDPRTKAVLCDTPITASSSETVAKALADKLAALRAGTDVVVVPDPLTDNRGPTLAPGRVPESATKTKVVCITYRDLVTEKDTFACHPTMAACMKHRAEMKTAPTRTAIEVSACTAVGGR